MKRILSIFVAVMMIAVCLAGCTKKVELPEGAISFNETLDLLDQKTPKTEYDKTVVAEYDGNELTLSTFRNMYLTLSSQYPYYYGLDWMDNAETVELFNEQLDEYLRYGFALLRMASDAEIYITKEDIDFAFEQFDSLKEMYGDEPETVITTVSYHSPHSFLSNVVLNMVYNNLYTSMYSPDSENFDRIKAATLEEFAKNDIIRAKHILIKFPVAAEELTDEQKAETLAKAEEVMDKINAGENFDTLVKEYNADAGMPESGYYFGKNEMVIEFETAAYALEENAVSGIVETPYGYHIIKRLPLNDDNLAYSNQYYSLSYDDFETAIRETLDKVEESKYKNYETLIAPVVQEAKDYLADLNKQYEESLSETTEGETVTTEENVAE